jgi:ABC-type multidrug transport system ATPase subunit
LIDETMPVIVIAPYEHNARDRRDGASLVVRGLSLEVMAMETVCLLGRNGAGKTTTPWRSPVNETNGRLKNLGFDTQPKSPGLRRHPRTSFHHQPEAQHRKSLAIHKNAGDYSIFPE